MPVMRAKLALFVAVVSGLASPLAACLGPTEIMLDVRTNVPCSDASRWRGVAVSVGQPGADVESRSPVLTTTTCGAGGEIGTLAVVPTGSKDAQVGIRVVAGITRNPEDCAAQGYDGCVVARRTVAYLPHESQHLLIELTSDCLGNGCDVNHTCVNGSCTDTVTARPPVAPDGGLLGTTVRCGDDGTRCPANDPSNACCVAFDFDAGTGKGSCMPAAMCPSTSAVLYCDDPTDCAPNLADAGDPSICCLSNENVASDPNFRLTNSTCQLASTCSGANYFGQTRTLCDERRVCPGTGNNCTLAAGAPGYFACQALP